MSNAERPRIAITCDDLNTNRALANISHTGLFVHGDMIVTNRRGFPAFETFVNQNRARIARTDPGIHINVLEGEDFPCDDRRLFGTNGTLFQWLYAYEHHDHNSRLPFFRKAFRQHVNRFITRNQKHIYDEIARQIDVFTDVWKESPSWMSYHFGVHYLPPLHDIYEKVAMDYNIPHRHAAQYTGQRRKYHLDVYDNLNDNQVDEDRVLGTLEKIKKSRRRAEIMVHFGELAYGDQQRTVFMQPKVKEALKDFAIEMPHVLWREIQPESSK